jgi:hypothetical protein
MVELVVLAFGNAGLFPLRFQLWADRISDNYRVSIDRLGSGHWLVVARLPH